MKVTFWLKNKRIDGDLLRCNKLTAWVWVFWTTLKHPFPKVIKRHINHHGVTGLPVYAGPFCVWGGV